MQILQSCVGIGRKPSVEMIAATRLFTVIDQITQLPIMSPAGESRHSKRVDHLLDAEVPKDKHNVDAAR